MELKLDLLPFSAYNYDGVSLGCGVGEWGGWVNDIRVKI